MNRIQASENGANGNAAVMTSSEAKAIIEQEQKQRIDSCQEEINAVLEKYNCALDVMVILRQGQVTSQIGLIAK